MSWDGLSNEVDLKGEDTSSKQVGREGSSEECVEPSVDGGR